MKKETILIAHNYTENTFSAMSYNLAHYWAQTGHDIIFLSHKPYFDKPKIEKVNNNYIFIYSWSTKNKPTSLKDILHFAKIFKRHKPKKVIGHFVGANISIFVAKILSFGKVITFDYYHTLSSQLVLDGNISRFRKLRKYVFYKYFVDYVLPYSYLGLKDYEKFYRLKNAILHITPLIDRKKNPNWNNKIIQLKIGFIGRLDKSKGVEHLIELVRSVDSSKFIFNIAGTGFFYHDLINLKNQYKNVNFNGAINYHEVDDFLFNCDVVIIPSISDCFNYVALEALMNGRCLVISKYAGISDFLENNVDCLKINPNFEDLKKISDLLYKNEDLIKRISEAGRKTYERLFTMEKYFETMDNIILNKNAKRI